MMQQPTFPQPETIIYALVRFSELRYLEDFRSTGRLRMARLSAYQAVEDDVGRGDANDGLAGWYQPDQCVVKFGGITLTGVVAPIKVSFNATSEHHVACFHAITSERLPAIFNEGSLTIDPKNFGLGTHALVIGNVTEFVSRVVAAVKKADIEMQAGPVRYVDPDVHHGQLGAFQKFKAYAFQSEWRVLVDPSADEHYWLDIGSIEDISQIASVADVNSFIKLSMPED